MRWLLVFMMDGESHNFYILNIKFILFFNYNIGAHFSLTQMINNFRSIIFDPIKILFLHKNARRNPIFNFSNFIFELCTPACFYFKSVLFSYLWGVCKDWQF